MLFDWNASVIMYKGLKGVEEFCKYVSAGDIAGVLQYDECDAVVLVIGWIDKTGSYVLVDSGIP